MKSAVITPFGGTIISISVSSFQSFFFCVQITQLLKLGNFKSVYNVYTSLYPGLFHCSCWTYGGKISPCHYTFLENITLTGSMLFRPVNAPQLVKDQLPAVHRLGFLFPCWVLSTTVKMALCACLGFALWNREWEHVWSWTYMRLNYPSPHTPLPSQLPRLTLQGCVRTVEKLGVDTLGSNLGSVTFSPMVLGQSQEFSAPQTSHLQVEE